MKEGVKINMKRAGIKDVMLKEIGMWLSLLI